jgi:hypothetical protein
LESLKLILSKAISKSFSENDLVIGMDLSPTHLSGISQKKGDMNPSPKSKIVFNGLR